MKKFHGTGVALVTPFTQNNEIDYPALRKLLKHTAKGVDYYVVMGTTGESPTLTTAEKQAVLQFVINNNAKQLPIVYGIGGNNTQAVVDQIKNTDLSGVDGILSVSPAYNKPSQEGIYEHFKLIASKSPVPIILYNVPGRTGSNITAETTLRLANLKNVVGIKEASGDLVQCMRIAKDKPTDFALISGDDLYTSAFYGIGGEGVISVLANALPVVFRKIKEYARKGDMKRASQEQFKLLEINPSMYAEGNPVGIKYLASLQGTMNPICRLPLLEASSTLKKQIEAIYKKMALK